MGKVVSIAEPDDPMILYPGVAPLDPRGILLFRELAYAMNEEIPDDHMTLAQYADLEDWVRRGRPHRNPLKEYLERAREAGPEVEDAFLACAGFYVAGVETGMVPEVGVIERQVLDKMGVAYE